MSLQLANISMIGWVHTLLTLLALGLAVTILCRPKGTPVHRRLGRIYIVSLFLGSALSLTIYRATGSCLFPHVLAIATLVLLGIGYLAAHFHQPKYLWKHIHLSAMILSLYLIVGGGVNEAFLRIGYLREQIGSGRALALTHATVFLFFMALVLVFNLAAIVGSLMRRRAKAVA
jgi:uncharacterized membrane protein